MITNDERRQKHLEDVDRVLADVREHLRAGNAVDEVDELRALELLLEVTKAFQRERDTTKLITLVLDSALSFPGADRAFLMLLDAQGQPRFKMGRSYDGDYLTPDDFQISTGVVEETLAACKPLILLDAQNDARFKSRDSIVKLALRMVMSAPLRCDDGSTLGLIYIDARRPLVQYNKHHLNVLTTLADQAALALRKQRKFDTYTG